MATDKIRVAIVGGAGTWGRYYTQAYAANPACELIALVDKAKDRRDQFAEHYGIARTCDSIEELLATDVPDVVSAILPVAFTHDIVIACAEAGVKAVSCEKPLDYQLSRADETVRICRERGTAFGCGTAHWDDPFLEETIDWIRQGHIGKLAAAAMPGGLPTEVSGGGCHPLVRMLYVTGMDVEWVEGAVHAPEPTYANPEAEKETEIDRPAWGRLGLSGGIICDILDPKLDLPATCDMSVTGEEGQVFITRSQPIFIQGTGPAASPVIPEFLQGDQSAGAVHMMHYATARMIEAVANNRTEVPCSGADYLQVLEIAIALTLSAHNNGERITLPLEDRSHKIYPHPYRLYGGDLAGWETIGYKGPPDLPK
jgi:predicted dehydrogenase